MLFVIAGPSGVGKSYLIKAVLQQFPGEFISPQLTTTRTARAGNTEIDRQSVSLEEFKLKESAGEFLITGEFRGNWYGFPIAITASRSEHVIVNTWPALIPQFAELPGVKLIGLTVADDTVELLRTRMFQRGDSPEAVAERMEQIGIDIADLQKYQSLVAAHGKLFEISGNDTIPEQVIPWIIRQI